MFWNTRAQVILKSNFRIMNNNNHGGGWVIGLGYRPR